MNPNITVPNNATAVTISASGIVQAQIPGQTAPQNLGQIQMARFVNKVGLESIGDNLFVETLASGRRSPAIPAPTGSATSSRATSKRPTSTRSRRFPR